MTNDRSWEQTLTAYIREGEPDQATKSKAWQIAIGLQQVDRLETSDYLLGIAREHIEGRIDIHQAQCRIASYYEAEAQRKAVEDGTAEADIVSSRITELLCEKAFQFSPATLQTIHRRLFEGVFDHAGQFRMYNISKKEWVLDGASVIYASWESIPDTLDYDFRMEKNFSYEGLTLQAAIHHLAAFTSGIWQIHPFAEGNTRATAVFIIKYMKSFGLNVDNEAFMDHSWYFRNALVRANYNDLQQGVHATTEYLEHFLENLLLGTAHPLKNRSLHLHYAELSENANPQSAMSKVPKCQFGTLDCSLEELVLLHAIIEDSTVTQKALQEKTGLALRTIKRMMASMQEKGYIRRVGGKRYGYWECLVADHLQ